MSWTSEPHKRARNRKVGAAEQAEPAKPEVGESQPDDAQAPEVEKPLHSPRGAKKITPVRAGGKNRSRGRTVRAAKANRMATGTIVMFVVVGIAALAIVGYAVFKTYDSSRPFGQQRAQQIDGLVNYRAKDPKMLTRKHVDGPVAYKVSPPVGGNHYPVWEKCEGDVYAQPLPNERAVHSLEHGAVWITYRPDLPKADVDKLAKKVRGQEYMLMSPYPGLKSAVSLQAWGFQLKLDSVNDPRLDEFIVAFRKTASVEPGSNCGLPQDANQGGIPGAPPGGGLPGGGLPGGGLPGGVTQ